MHSGVILGSRKPFLPSVMMSGIPPTEVASTGVPHAIASRTMFGNPSDCDGTTINLHSFNAAGIELHGICPLKSTSW